jgi:plastocyanin
MRARPLLAWIAIAFAATPAAWAEPRAEDRPATQADLDRLEKKLDAQQRTIDKLLQLNEQYLRQLVALLSEASGARPSGDAAIATIKPAPAEPKPPEPRVAAGKPRAAAKLGTVTGKVNGGGGEAFVYVEDVAATGHGVATMKQEGKQFSPRLLVVARGTKVVFPNFDALFHNVFSVTPDNSFDLGSYPQGSSKSVTMTKPGVVTVYCNLHPQMIGYILVAPSALYVQAGEDGAFRLANVPVGHHRIVAWAPNAKPVTAEVDVTEAESPPIELAVKRGRPGPHTNKDGIAYGSYKD